MLSPSSVEDFAGTERFTIRRRVGVGGMGVVYEAYDRQRDQPVALKTIRHFDASTLYWFKKEFRVLADVVHPNLVRLWELISDGDRWFFTMELVDGTDFLSYVRPGPRAPDGSADPRSVDTVPFLDRPPTTARDDGGGSTLASTRRGPDLSVAGAGDANSARADSEAGTAVPPTEVDDGASRPSGQAADTHAARTTLPLRIAAVPATPDPPAEMGVDLPRLRSALGQLAAALAALHSLGKIHRDLKPSNVMVERGGRVVVLDFGVAAELGRFDEPEATEYHLVGTVEYMSPEQAIEGALTPASDWYTFGVMLYSALTGRVPYGGSRLEVLVKKQQGAPPDPALLTPGLPEDLRSLCIDLLRANPDDRPTGDEVLRRLGTAAPPTAAAQGAALAQGRPFLGRRPHLAELESAFAASRSGRAVVAFVRGRSGAGKSALVQHFFEGLAARDVAVILEGRCFEQESVAYKALDALIDSLTRHLRRLPRLEAEALLPRDIAALARVFPVLTRIDAVASAPRRVAEAPDRQELRRRAFAALRELLARIGDRRPLVLHIDDLQWGDLDSADLLAELLRPPDAPALLLLCCFRSEYAQVSPCLRRLLEAGGDGPLGAGLRQIDVDALTPDEARDLARLLIGSPGAVGEALVDMVARESGGSPYFVYELCRYLTEGGDLSESLQAAGSFSLDEVLWRRVIGLPAGPRRLLETIAVAGKPIRQGTACRAADLAAEGMSALAHLRANHLVRGRGAGALDEVEAYHDRIRETVARRLSPKDLSACHLRLAVELEAASEADPETLAVHFEEAGRPDDAARYLVQAAADAAEALAFDRAATLYRRVLTLRSAAAPEVPGLRVRLAEALANAGRGGDAGTAFLEAAAVAEPGQVHDLQARAAYQFLISGRIDEGLAAFDEVLARVGLRRPETPVGALVRMLKERFILGVRGLGYRPQAAEAVPPSALARVDAARAVAVGISVGDVIQGSYFQTRSLRLALDAGEPERIALALSWEGVHSACAGRASRRRTARLIARAEEVARRVDTPHARGMATLAAGAAAYFNSRFGEALGLLDRATALFRDGCTGVVWELDTSQVFGLWARIYKGEIAELSRHFVAIDREARGRGDRYMESTLGTYPGVIARLAADEPEEARAAADEAIARWSQHGFHVQHLTHYYGLTYADLYLGDGPSAWERTERTAPAIRASLLPRIQHVKVDLLQLRGRSALAAAARCADPAPLLLAADRASRALDRERSPWGLVASRVLRAGAASLRGDAPSAIRILRPTIARADAEQLGLFSASSRRALGLLLGGDEGRDLIARADAWMTSQGIRNPPLMASCLAPGFLA